LLIENYYIMADIKALKIKKAVKSDLTVWVYTPNQKYKKKMNLDNYCSSKRVSKKAVLTACKSFKGYGFVKDEYVSLSKIEHWWSIEEVTEFFNTWLRKNLKKNITKLKGMYGKKYKEEYLSSALQYMVNAIHSERSINAFEQALVYKYKTSMLDAERTDKAKQGNGLVADFMIIDKDGNEESYIRTYATEDIWHKEYSCINDYNSIKQLDIIGNILKERFPMIQAELFVSILQENYDFKSLDKIPDFKYSTLIRKYKNEVKLLKPSDCSLSNTEFLKEMIQDCWDEMILLLDRIKEEANVHTYKDLDDYTLNEFF
jgi:hypothetical protein